MQAILMKSIYRDINSKEQNLKHYEHLEEYIKVQRQQGNIVRLPKINKNLVATQIKDTAVIKLYHIQQRKVVRQVKLQFEDATFNSYMKLEQLDDDDLNQLETPEDQQQKQILSVDSDDEIESDTVEQEDDKIAMEIIQENRKQQIQNQISNHLQGLLQLKSRGKSSKQLEPDGVLMKELT